MANGEGIVYVTWGMPAKRAAAQSQQTLRKVSDLPIYVVDETTFSGDPGYGARFAKLNIDLLVPWDYVLYLDADTEVFGDIGAGFEILRKGWDMVIVPSVNQNSECMAHLELEDRAHTCKTLGLPLPYILQLQGGVFWCHKERCKKFFEIWREEWSWMKKKDQGALLRALERCPLKIWLLGRPFNSVQRGDAVVWHNFGSAVSRGLV